MMANRKKTQIIKDKDLEIELENDDDEGDEVVEESSSDDDGGGEGDFDDEKTSLKPESEAGSILEPKVNLRKKKKAASVVNPKNKPRLVMNVSGKELIIFFDPILFDSLRREYLYYYS
jgi:hypothetical protein